jgi:ribosomal protein S18 acetylase RimI-like enzyme
MDSQSAILVRLARPHERDAIRDLTLSAYGQYATIMEPSAWNGLRSSIEAALSIDRGAQQIVAEQGGELVGSVMLFPPSADAYAELGLRVRTPEIRALAVAPSARGRGVARLLVHECLRRARATGADAIGLHTSPSMRDAIRLYEKFGFTRDPALDIQVVGAEPIQAYRLALDARVTGL